MKNNYDRTSVLESNKYFLDGVRLNVIIKD